MDYKDGPLSTKAEAKSHVIPSDQYYYNFAKVVEKEDRKDEEQIENFHGGGRGGGGFRGGRSGYWGGGRWNRRYNYGGVGYNYLYRTPYYYYDYGYPWYYTLPYIFGSPFYEEPNDMFFAEETKGDEERFDLDNLIQGNTMIILVLLGVIGYMYFKKQK